MYINAAEKAGLRVPMQAVFVLVVGFVWLGAPVSVWLHFTIVFIMLAMDRISEQVTLSVSR